MKTITMMALRNTVLRSTSGHNVRFEKSVPKEVPYPCLDEALAMGIVPVESDDLIPPEMDKTFEPVGYEREEAIMDAIEQLVVGNSRLSFTAGGRPTKVAITTAAGFPIDTKEINRLWEKYKEKQIEETLETQL